MYLLIAYSFADNVCSLSDYKWTIHIYWHYWNGSNVLVLHILCCFYIFDLNIHQIALSCSSFSFFFQDLFSISAYVYAQKPQLDIHSFEGNFTRVRKCCAYIHTNAQNICWKMNTPKNPSTANCTFPWCFFYFIIIIIAFVNAKLQSCLSSPMEMTSQAVRICPLPSSLLTSD